MSCAARTFQEAPRTGWASILFAVIPGGTTVASIISNRLALVNWTYLLATAAVGIAILVGCLVRFIYILPINERRRATTRATRNVQPVSRRSATDTCKTAVFLGSGGHTTEIFLLLSALDLHKRYTPRIYFVSAGDRFSADKARHFEQQQRQNLSLSEQQKDHDEAYEIIELPRARSVHQSWLSTPLSTLLSFVACLKYITVVPLLRCFRRDSRTGPSTSSSSSSAPSIHFRSTTLAAAADVVLMNGPGTCVPLVAAVYCNRMLGLHSPKLIYVESFARVKSLSLTAKILRHLVDRFVVQWPSASDGEGEQQKTGDRDGVSGVTESPRQQGRDAQCDDAVNPTGQDRSGAAHYRGWLV